ncbi:MAG: hypothetical protein L6408_04440 [Nanoarchaeota archaeon]|nr:hypothetical protein [Nanoarchaeota archaeon]
MIGMCEIVVEIPDALKQITDEYLEEADTKLLLREAVEEKLKLLLLFKVVDKILKKSKLTDEKFNELVEEYRERLAKRYGVI